MKSYSICLSLSSLFHLAKCPLEGSFFFLRLNSITLFRCTTYSLSIHLLMDTRLFLCLSYCDNAAITLRMVSFPLDIYPEVELLDHMALIIIDLIS